MKAGLIRLAVAVSLLVAAIFIFYPLKVYHVTSDFDSGISIFIIGIALIWILSIGGRWVFNGFKQNINADQGFSKKDHG